MYYFPCHPWLLGLGETSGSGLISDSGLRLHLLQLCAPRQIILFLLLLYSILQDIYHNYHPGLLNDVEGCRTLNTWQVHLGPLSRWLPASFHSLMPPFSPSLAAFLFMTELSLFSPFFLFVPVGVCMLSLCTLFLWYPFTETCQRWLYFNSIVLMIILATKFNCILWSSAYRE